MDNLSHSIHHVIASLFLILKFMKNNFPTFSIDTSAFNRVMHKIGARLDLDDKVMKKRMIAATNMVWRVAHQKRPYISKAKMKGEGRSFPVSDPYAIAGVPVAYRNGGTLQASVTQYVIRKSLLSYQGEVRAHGAPYMGYIEYGTSKMAARPFMRPAINLTQDAIRRSMGLRIESNLTNV